MKVFIFDLLPYGSISTSTRRRSICPTRCPRSLRREIAAQTYEQHLQAWEEMDKLGFDGVGLNEHHTTPHGMMNSPNMMAAVGAQRTKRLKFLMLGNLVPLHNPLRIAEELAMADTHVARAHLSGFARGVPREYNVYGVSMAESRARFEEAVEIILKAWTEPKFSHEGKFWSYKDIAIWPRPYQQPHPPVWVPFTGSKETIEWAGKHNFSAVIPDHQSRPDRKTSSAITPSSSRRTATRSRPSTCASSPTPMWRRTRPRRSRNTARSISTSCTRCGTTARWRRRVALEGHRLSLVVVAGLHQAGESRAAPGSTARHAEDDDGRHRAEDRYRASSAWGSPKEVADRLIEGAERDGRRQPAAQYERRRHGARGVPGVYPAASAKEVLPRLQAHQVRRVPAGETVAA